MPDNLSEVKLATKRILTETAVGDEHLTIQDYRDDGYDIVGWERIKQCGHGSFVLYVA